MYELLSYGLLHSEISGSMRACHSPELIAAYRVLLRLLMPRHPPCALISLNSLFAELCLVLFFQNFFLGEVEIVFYPFFKVLPFLNWISYNFLFVVSLFNFQRSLSALKHLKPSDDVYGGLKWTRTIDLSVISRCASVDASRQPDQLSYQPILPYLLWWRLRESNP